MEQLEVIQFFMESGGNNLFPFVINSLDEDGLELILDNDWNNDFIVIDGIEYNGENIQKMFSFENWLMRQGVYAETGELGEVEEELKIIQDEEKSLNTNSFYILIKFDIDNGIEWSVGKNMTLQDIWSNNKMESYGYSLDYVIDTLSEIVVSGNIVGIWGE